VIISGSGTLGIIAMGFGSMVLIQFPVCPSFSMEGAVQAENLIIRGLEHIDLKTR